MKRLSGNVAVFIFATSLLVACSAAGVGDPTSGIIPSTNSGSGNGTGTPAGMVYVQQGTGGFYMDTTEVTQEAYQRVIGSNPSYFTGCPTCPVEQVNWADADAYCRAVGKRLPTETEWEYAATSGGTGQAYAGTGDVTLLPQYAWYVDNSGLTTHPVAQKLPNGLGLYDMSGNVWEWTDSWFDATNTNRVLRGGSFGRDADSLRATFRAYIGPTDSSSVYGFRCINSGSGTSSTATDTGTASSTSTNTDTSAGAGSGSGGGYYVGSCATPSIHQCTETSSTSLEVISGFESSCKSNISEPGVWLPAHCGEPFGALGRCTFSAYGPILSSIVYWHDAGPDPANIDWNYQFVRSNCINVTGTVGAWSDLHGVIHSKPIFPIERNK